MNEGSSLQQVSDWSKKLGILTPANASLDIAQIISQCESAQSIPLQDIESILLKAVAYSFYLKSEKGSIQAKLSLCESKIKRRMFIALTKAGDLQYKTKEEKESIACDIDSDLSALFDQQLVLKMQLFKVKDIPYAIDNAVDMIKIVYEKRVRAEQKTQ